MCYKFVASRNKLRSEMFVRIPSTHSLQRWPQESGDVRPNAAIASSGCVIAAEIKTVNLKELN